ncbi:cupin domain-containing protein [Fredinandcohnia humi]
MKISKMNAEHYTWGDNCDGWHLVNTPELSIIHERMPPGSAEELHYHNQARQFFFVLSGSATFKMDGKTVDIGAQEGIEVPPLVPHQILNQTNTDIEFVVTSQPNSRGDRVLV